MDSVAEKTASGEVRKNAKKTKMFQLVVLVLKKISLLLLGYTVCFFNWSLILPIITLSTIAWYENSTSARVERIQKKVQASSMSRREILEIVKELPSWVNFPDRERAEWVNEIISQLWPNVTGYIVKYCRGKIQTNIRKKIDSFRFEDIDFGHRPPKIDGVKVYHNKGSKDSIIIDFEVFYDGDCEVNFSISGTQIGRIRDFRMGVEIRTVLKPLLMKMPVVGGIQFFFLNIPDIHFELEGISGIPGLSYLIRQKIEEIINKKLVFPNKISKRFTKSIEAAELKSIEAEGVLRVHVFEARDLEKKDVTGKSDPYVILNLGAQEYRTKVIKRDLNPQWDEYCEFIILDPVAQQLYFKLFDQDEFNEDDFLGSGCVNIAEVIKHKNDEWFNLEQAKHGKVHLRFTWLALSCDLSAIERLRILHNGSFEEESDVDSDGSEPSTIREDNKIVVDEEELEKEFKKAVSMPFTQLSEPRGKVEMSMEYSELRQKLIVIIHRVMLPLKTPMPDLYVKLRLEGPGTPVKHRTKVVEESCDVDYQEKFEYLLSAAELSANRLIITVKNKKFFNSRILGQKIVDLRGFNGDSKKWYDLDEAEVSD